MFTAEIYIYAFGRCLYMKRISLHSRYTLHQFMHLLGIELISFRNPLRSDELIYVKVLLEKKHLKMRNCGEEMSIMDNNGNK